VRFPEDSRLLAAGVRSYVRVPLRMRERVVGSLAFSRRVPGPFSPHEVDVFEALARPIAAAVANARAFEEIARLTGQLQAENLALRQEIDERSMFEEIIGSSPALREALALVDKVAATDTTVLITGETGTGKELVARAIHYNGPRADRPFVSENCGALAPELLSSELFGYKKGAFTGASEDRAGLFEVANGGTLFLDEIGDCPPDLQTRLLRVLDQGEIRRVGDSQPIPVDVRILAATHHDLERDVAEGRFRKDLFFRLSVIPVLTPPLRERREDVPLLAEHFLERLAGRSGKRTLGFTAEALGLLAAHDYPGNVRELEKIVERAFTLGEAGAFLTPDLLPEKLAGLAPAPAGDDGLRAAVERFEAQCIREALQRNGNNQTHTAEELGVSRRALIDKLTKYAIR
jgi:transcriptional regulator with GAF, ATPase, and Fis domain